MCVRVASGWQAIRTDSRMSASFSLSSIPLCCLSAADLCLIFLSLVLFMPLENVRSLG